MTKLPQHGTFVPLFHAYLDLGLSYHQAALIAYIEKWNRGGNECFASVEQIGEELRLPYRTMRRVIDRSIAEGIITANTGNKGRARTLTITDSFWSKVEVKLASQMSKLSPEVSKVDKVCVQSGQLPRCIPRSNTNTNTETKFVWSEERQAMVRVRR